MVVSNGTGSPQAIGVSGTGTLGGSTGNRRGCRVLQRGARSLLHHNGCRRGFPARHQVRTVSGLARTGYSFNSYTNATAPASVAICRFFNDSLRRRVRISTPRTAWACEATIPASDWKLEDDKLFNEMLPTAAELSGRNHSGLSSVQPGMGGAPNHRFVTSLAERQKMINKGYVAEGARIGVGCARPVNATFAVAAARIGVRTGRAPVLFGRRTAALPRRPPSGATPPLHLLRVEEIARAASSSMAMVEQLPATMHSGAITLTDCQCRIACRCAGRDVAIAHSVEFEVALVVAAGRHRARREVEPGDCRPGDRDADADSPWSSIRLRASTRTSPARFTRPCVFRVLCRWLRHDPPHTLADPAKVDFHASPGQANGFAAPFHACPVDQASRLGKGSGRRQLRACA